MVELCVLPVSYTHLTELPVDTLIEYEDQLQTFGLNKREHFIYRVAGKKSFIVSDHPNLKEEKQPILQIREEKAPITGQLIEVYHRVPALSGKNVYLCADFEKHTETPVLEKKENERIDFCLTRLEPVSYTHLCRQNFSGGDSGGSTAMSFCPI